MSGWGLINEAKAWFVDSFLKNDVTETRQSLWVKNTNEREDGSFDVNLQDQTTPAFDLYFANYLEEDIQLSADASRNDLIISVASGTWAVGSNLYLYNTETNRFYYGSVVEVDGNDLTLDTPLNFDAPASDTLLKRVSYNMAVNGSVTPVKFILRPPIDIEIDVTRVSLSVIANDPINYNSFGDIAGGLLKGIYMRMINGSTFNYFNFKNNAEMITAAFENELFEEAKNPNVNGLVSRLEYAGQDNHGVTIRLKQDETLEIVVQDDLSSLVEFRALASGHVVE